MSDGDNQDDETIILDCSDDAVVADAITPQALWISCKRFAEAAGILRRGYTLA